MKTLKGIIIGLVVLALLGGLWLRYQAANEVWVYHVRADFEEMPADDSALQEWLVAQPGVKKVSIAREGKSLRVDYESSQPPTNSVRAVSMEASLRFGYRGRSNESNWFDKPMRLRLLGW